MTDRERTLIQHLPAGRLPATPHDTDTTRQAWLWECWCGWDTVNPSAATAYLDWRAHECLPR